MSVADVVSVVSFLQRNRVPINRGQIYLDGYIMEKDRKRRKKKKRRNGKGGEKSRIRIES